MHSKSNPLPNESDWNHGLWSLDYGPPSTIEAKDRQAINPSFRTRPIYSRISDFQLEANPLLCPVTCALQKIAQSIFGNRGGKRGRMPSQMTQTINQTTSASSCLLMRDADIAAPNIEQETIHKAWVTWQRVNRSLNDQSCISHLDLIDQWSRAMEAGLRLMRGIHRGHEVLQKHRRSCIQTLACIINCTVAAPLV